MSVYESMLGQYATSPYTSALRQITSPGIPSYETDAERLLQLFDQYRQQLAKTVSMNPTQYRLGDYLGKKGKEESSPTEKSGGEDLAPLPVPTSALWFSGPDGYGSGGEGGHGGPEGFQEGVAEVFGIPDYTEMSSKDLGIMQGIAGVLGLGDVLALAGYGLSTAKGIQNGLPTDVALKNALTPGNHLNTGVGLSAGPAGMSPGGHGGNYAGGLADAQSADAQTNAGGFGFGFGPDGSAGYGFGTDQQAADNPEGFADADFGWGGIAGEVESAMGGGFGDGGYGESLGGFGGPDGGWI